MMAWGVAYLLGGLDPSPVPETEEGRRFPDWNGGFTVRAQASVHRGCAHSRHPNPPSWGSGLQARVFIPTRNVTGEISVLLPLKGLPQFFDEAC